MFPVKSMHVSCVLYTKIKYLRSGEERAAACSVARRWICRRRADGGRGRSGGDRRVRWRLVDCRRSSAFRRDIPLRCQRLRRVGVSSAFPAGAASGAGSGTQPGTLGVPGKRCRTASCRREPRRVDFPRGFAKSQKTWFTCTVAFRGLAPEGNGASFPSGQRELTVNQPPSCFVGSNPTLATPRWLSGRAPPW